MSGGNASFSWHFKKAPDSNWIGGPTSTSTSEILAYPRQFT